MSCLTKAARILIPSVAIRPLLSRGSRCIARLFYEPRSIAVKTVNPQRINHLLRVLAPRRIDGRRPVFSQPGVGDGDRKVDRSTRDMKVRLPRPEPPHRCKETFYMHTRLAALVVGIGVVCGLSLGVAAQDTGAADGARRAIRWLCGG